MLYCVCAFHDSVCIILTENAVFVNQRKRKSQNSVRVISAVKIHVSWTNERVSGSDY